MHSFVVGVVGLVEVAELRHRTLPRHPVMAPARDHRSRGPVIAAPRRHYRKPASIRLAECVEAASGSQSSAFARNSRLAPAALELVRQRRRRRFAWKGSTCLLHPYVESMPWVCVTALQAFRPWLGVWLVMAVVT